MVGIIIFDIVGGWLTDATIADDARPSLPTLGAVGVAHTVELGRYPLDNTSNAPVPLLQRQLDAVEHPLARQPQVQRIAPALPTDELLT